MDLNTLPARFSVAGRKMQATLEKDANTAPLASAVSKVSRGSSSHKNLMREESDLSAI